MAPRSRQTNTLKHLPFFEALAVAPEGSPDAKFATAGLLTLRMLDHWVLAGASIVEPESVSVRSVRRAIMDLPPAEPIREALLGLVNAMQMLRVVDVTPVLPRLFSYGQLLERHHGRHALASDAYESVIRLATDDFDVDLTMESYARRAACLLKVGTLDDALASSQALVRLATRRRAPVHALHGRMGVGQVAMMRGDLAGAEALFEAIETEAESRGFARERAMALHNRAVVASRDGKPLHASVLAHRALKITADPVERDRVLADLAAFLVKSDRYEAALDALRILEVTASSGEPRIAAIANTVILAARTANRALFEESRSRLAGAQLPIEAQIAVLVESASALRAFGQEAEADSAINEARHLTATHGLAVDATAERIGTNSLANAQRGTLSEQDPALDVAADLRAMAAALAA